MTLPIHAVQLDSVWENKEANFSKVRALLAASPPAPGSLIVLSEMFATGFSCQVEATAEAEGAETETFLQSLAAEYQSCVIGGVVTESVFAIPGLGSLAFSSILKGDVPVVLGVVMLAALFIVFVQLVVDISYAVLDPRVRLA